MIELNACKQSSLPFKQKPQMTKGSAERKEPGFLCLLKFGRAPGINVVHSVSSFLLEGFPACSSKAAWPDMRAQKRAGLHSPLPYHMRHQTNMKTWLA